ncbi:MAG TPA: hypothetical protein VMR46_02335 [Candidatus Paceibacterota bacterium]|nr:hypothetical protein [Candidatus Paceibacterota bacterium]
MMIVQTGNSTYQLSGVGSSFEVRKLSQNSGSVATGQSILGDHFSLQIGEGLMLWREGRIVLATSPVVSVLG